MIKVYGKEGCPQCEILYKKLKDKNVEFEYIQDIDKAIEKGIRAFPTMELEGEMLNYLKSIQYINKL